MKARNAFLQFFKTFRLMNHITSRNMTSTNPNAGPVVVEKFENVQMIGINRPEKRNAVNHSTALALKAAFDDFNADESVAAAVLYGVGGNFCAGYDLTELSSQNSEENNPIISELDKSNSCFRPMGASMMKMRKPVVAAVEGFAVAGGLELALMCDLRLVDETAIFGVYCRRYGVPLIDGGTVRLPKLIGLSRAMDMILTGREVNAKTALDWGLANRMVTTGAALGQAMELARLLTRFPQACMLADRRSAYYSTYEAPSFKNAIDFELRNGLPIVAQESVKGAQRFVSGIGRHGSFNLDRPPGPKKGKL